MNDTTLPVAVASAAISAGHPDAELVAASRQYIAARLAYNAATDDADDDEEDRRWASLTAIEKSVFETPAQTLQGVLAKARAAEESGLDEQAWTVVADLLWVSDQPSPDAVMRDAFPNT